MYFCISVSPPPPHDPPPGLPLGLASLLVSSAPPAPAVVPPGGAVLGARSLMDVLAAAPRGLMSLLSMSTQDDDNDNNDNDNSNAFQALLACTHAAQRLLQ